MNSLEVYLLTSLSLSAPQSFLGYSLRNRMALERHSPAPYGSDEFFVNHLLRYGDIDGEKACKNNTL